MKISDIHISRLFLASIMAFFVTSCGNGAKSAEGNAETEEEEGELTEVVLTDRQMKTVGIATGHIENRQLGQVVKVNGQLALDPQDRAEVSPLTGGIVRAILVKEGNTVKAGQAVAYIENTEVLELQKSYLTARSEMLSAKAELDRQDLLTAQGAGVKKTRQQAKSAYDIAYAQLSGLSKQLSQLGINPSQVAQGNLASHIPVKSPISGTVGKINISLGSYADMQTVLMTIVDNGRLHCDLKVFEKDVPYLKVGQKTDLVLTNEKNISMTGVIYSINAAFDNDAKAITVHAHITGKPAARLMPGMFVTGLVNTGKHELQAVPNEAIVSKDGRKYIFLLVEKTKEGSKFRPVEVVTGVSELGYTAITTVEKVADDALFVTANAFYLASIMEGEPEED